MGLERYLYFRGGGLLANNLSGVGIAIFNTVKCLFNSNRITKKYFYINYERLEPQQLPTAPVPAPLRIFINSFYLVITVRSVSLDDRVF